MNNQEEKLNEVYQCIQKCNICPNVQSEKVIRLIEKINTKAEVIIIAEAMAPSQVRISGVNFFDINGKIGNTWIMLEKFLQKLQLSVYPEHINCIYNTEIVHCFPGYDTNKTKKSIRRPSSDEINNCLSQSFLTKEIDLIKPKIIILMWKTSYETFYKNFLWLSITKNLTQKIEDIKNTKQIDFYKNYPIFPLQHASWANPRFHKMIDDVVYIELINSYLKR